MRGALKVRCKYSLTYRLGRHSLPPERRNAEGRRQNGEKLPQKLTKETKGNPSARRRRVRPGRSRSPIGEQGVWNRGNWAVFKCLTVRHLISRTARRACRNEGRRQKAESGLGKAFTEGNEGNEGDWGTLQMRIAGAQNVRADRRNS